LKCTNEIFPEGGGVFGKVKEQTWCLATEKFVRVRSFSLVDLFACIVVSFKW